jgi:hypothetical protein
MQRRTMLAGLAIALLASALVAGTAQAQPVDPWIGWVGCWQLIADEVSQLDVGGIRRVCVAREDQGVVLTSTVDDREVLRRVIHADGSERPVDERGCGGTERAWWSADGARLLATSDLACEGGRRRQTSGVSLLASSTRWTDIQVANVEGQREVLVRRYRRIDTDNSPAVRNLTLAAASARQAAAAPLQLEDVLEATAMLDPAVVETLLLETELDFVVDADALMTLARADVPANVIDLLVALSYPDYFAVGDEDQQMAAAGPLVQSYPVTSFGYWSYGFSPFGWGYYGYPAGPIVIRPGSAYGGRVVNGSGYTRVRTKPDAPRGGLAAIFSGAGAKRGSNGNGSGGTMGRDGASSSGSSSRTAKPRGGGQSGKNSATTGRKAKRRGGPGS